VQGARRDLVAREPAQALPFALEHSARHLDQAVAAPVPRRLAQAIAVRIEAVEEGALGRRPPRLAFIEAAGADVRAGLDGLITRGGGVDEQAAGLIQGGAAADEIVGDGRVDRQLASGIVNAGDAGALLGNDAAGDVFGIGCGRGDMIRSLTGRSVAAGRRSLLCRSGWSR
jgi:hypothetical protein